MKDNQKNQIKNQSIINFFRFFGLYSLFFFHFHFKISIFAPASPKQPAPENPPGWERSKGNRL